MSSYLVSINLPKNQLQMPPQKYELLMIWAERLINRVAPSDHQQQNTEWTLLSSINERLAI